MLVGYPPYYSDRLKDLFSRIKSGKLKFPKHVSGEAKRLLGKMLKRDPAKRPTIPQIKSHELFSGINWEQLANKEISLASSN